MTHEQASQLIEILDETKIAILIIMSCVIYISGVKFIENMFKR